MQPLTRLTWRVLIACLMFCSPLLAGERGEHPQPDAVKGAALVKTLCVNCHVIPGASQTGVPDGVPTFNELANRPGQTRMGVIGALILPHYPMPRTHLTRKEMMDIIAYVDTLRAQKSNPPLLPPRRLKKTKPKRDKVS